MNLAIAGRAEVMSAQEWVPENGDVAALREAAADCEGCELHGPATQTVFSAGNSNAPLMLVGEQPGDVEDREGIPFVGPAGRLLQQAADEAGLDRSALYVTNAVKHFRFTVKGKRRIHQTPGSEHMRACRPWLESELAVLQPEVVVCLGATAAKTLISPSFRITQERGRLLPWTPPGLDAVDDEEDSPHQMWMLATTHPSAVLRVPDDKRGPAYDELVADLTVVAGALDR
jgi:uracil-DNA glycosylase family protein